MLDPVFQNTSIDYFHSSVAETKTDWPAELSEIMGPIAIAQAVEEISQWPAYAPTPLRQFTGLAAELGVHNIYYKDEATRFGLGSFKALGGAYAVLCLLRRELSQKLDREVDFAEIRSGALAEHTRNIMVATATDGNHGRSVAWGSQQFNCGCTIYIHAEVSEGRKAAMEAFGATVVRVDGNYDASVQQAERDANDNGWFIVSDTSYEGYVDLPRHVAAGYTLFMDEAIAAINAIDGESAPTHVFVQGGVGGLASAVFGYLWQKYGRDRPRFVMVEPNLADCLLQSARNARATLVDIQDETIMAGLSCGEVSLLGWRIIEPCVDDYLSIDDELVAPTMRMLADGAFDQAPVVAGESGVAGLSGLIAACQQPSLKTALGLTAQSRVMVIGTEGATDPEIYEQIVGRPATAVA
ncbi:MAG: diaminopropionate ammonia-lyase [Pseudomonadota bacterium]